jgi:hypothetical protein
MGIITGMLSLVAFFRAVTEVSLILVFGYFIPVVETLAAIRTQPETHPIGDAKMDSLVGMWTGIVCLEAISGVKITKQEMLGLSEWSI